MKITNDIIENFTSKLFRDSIYNGASFEEAEKLRIGYEIYLAKMKLGQDVNLLLKKAEYKKHWLFKYFV